MNISKILSFIAAILAGLTLLCVFFPSSGIEVWGVRLEFPSLLSVLQPGSGEEDIEEETLTLTPEELLENRMASLQTRKIEEFRTFATTSPQRIYLPGGDETYLDAFFESLEKADSQHVRILHLGDSQLECDRISSSLREHYQQQFGGHGVGLVPALQTVSTYTLSQTISSGDSIGHYLVYGPAAMRAPHHRYGIMGQVNRVASGTVIRLSARDVAKYPSSGQIRCVTVMASGSGGMTLRAGSQTQAFEAETINESFVRYRAVLSQPADAVTISVSGTHDIYGIQLDDQCGVSLDNVPMRGCSGTIFSQIDAGTLTPFFTHENVRLLILQYGGNSVPSCSGEKGISSYMTTLRKQIRLFRRMAPEATILFIGPADMATRMGGEMKTYTILPQMVDSLREMSNQEGVAFWDMYAAMGGRGSIVRWYRANPQLAGSDFVHFTPKGAQKMADMLYGTLSLYYRFYRLRMGKEGEDEMKDMQFRDAVAPVQGSSVISVSELPPPHSGSADDEEGDVEMTAEEPEGAPSSDAGQEPAEPQAEKAESHAAEPGAAETE